MFQKLGCSLDHRPDHRIQECTVIAQDRERKKKGSGRGEGFIYPEAAGQPKITRPVESRGTTRFSEAVSAVAHQEPANGVVKRTAASGKVNKSVPILAAHRHIEFCVRESSYSVKRRFINRWQMALWLPDFVY